MLNLLLFILGIIVANNFVMGFECSIGSQETSFIAKHTEHIEAGVLV